jgi:altronate dehydratase small subunit
MQLTWDEDRVTIALVEAANEIETGAGYRRWVMSAKGALMLSEKDNVATAIEDIVAGMEVSVRLGREVRNVRALEDIPFGFKIALADIAKDTPVIKYGEEIGLASANIGQGEKVHIHNLAGARGRGDLSIQTKVFLRD